MTTVLSTMKKIICPGCKKNLKVGTELIGKKVKCPFCKTVFQIDAFSPKTAIPEQTISEKPPKVFTPPKETYSTPAIITKPQDKKTLICHWCSQEMPASAKNCPHCTKLRIDIYKAKSDLHIFGGVFILLFLVACALIGIGLAERWWHIRNEEPITRKSEDVVNDVVDNMLYKSIERLDGEEAAMKAKYGKDFSLYSFSWKKFLSSFLGIFIIILLVVDAVGLDYFKHRVSKKLGVSVLRV